MAFGKRKNRNHDDDDMLENQETEQVVSLDDESDDENQNQTQSSTPKASDSNSKPLHNEIIIHGAADGKNPGGTQKWTCKHCHLSRSSSYTRIHYHFFGPPPGKKADIQRCSVLMNNREEYERVRKRVYEAEKTGVSSSLKNSTLLKRNNAGVRQKTVVDSIKHWNKDEVDMKVMRGLCANGIPFNVLRNPQFHEMISAVNKAPKGYKAPNYEKARTTLLDQCKRDVEKDLITIKDTWYTHGVSIVSDGWGNVKHEPLINVLAVNTKAMLITS